MLPKEQLESRGIRDLRVLQAVRTVPRERFVPVAMRPHAMEDRALDIGFRATISQPYMVAAMTELLEIQPGHRILEIGTGSGYQAAVLSLLAAEVYSVEYVPQLATTAAALLRKLGYLNVQVREGDGYKGWPEHAPYDRILLTAAPLVIPNQLLDQLANGGRLVAPVGEHDQQQLVLISKARNGRLDSRTLFPVSFVPMVIQV